MRSIQVVVPTPILDDRACLLAGAEPFGAQAFVPQLAVEAFVCAILPRLARVDEGGADSALLQPAQDRTAHEFWPIVRAQEKRRSVQRDQAGQDLDHALRSDAALHVDLQALPRPFVDDRQAFELLVVGAGIEHEVVRPDLVRPSCWNRSGPGRRNALSRAFPWDLKTGGTPQPVRPIPAHPVALALQVDVDAAVSEP